MIDRFRKLPLTCSCGREVIIEVQRDGGRHETRSYMVRCNCGRIVEELPDNASGLKRDAIATWNRIRRSEILIGGNLSAVQRLVEPRDLVALPPSEIAPEQALANPREVLP